MNNDNIDPKKEGKEWEGGNDTLAENNAKNQAYLKTAEFEEKAKKSREKSNEEESDLNYEARNVTRTSVRDNIPNTITDRTIE